MLCSVSEASHYAKLLISGYPNSTITEPEYYISQLVSVMTGFEHDLVKTACTPAGIPAESPKFLPTVGEVRNWLISKAAIQEKSARYSALPPPAEYVKKVDFVKEGQETYSQFLARGGVRPTGMFEYKKGE